MVPIMIIIYQISKVKRKSKEKRKKKEEEKGECLRRFEQLQAKQACREALNNFDLFPFVSLSRFLQTGNPSAEDLFQIWHADIRTLSLFPPLSPSSSLRMTKYIIHYASYMYTLIEEPKKKDEDLLLFPHRNMFLVRYPFFVCFFILIIKKRRLC